MTTLTAQERVDSGHGDPVFVCDVADVCARAASVSECRDLVIGQTAIPMTLAGLETAASRVEPFRAASPAGYTSLPDGVAHVVEARPKEQMVGTNTAAVVAVMADVQAVWDRTMRERVGKPMRPNNARSIRTKSAVSVRGNGCGPVPATVCFLNVRPEARFRRRDDVDPVALDHNLYLTPKVES